MIGTDLSILLRAGLTMAVVLAAASSPAPAQDSSQPSPNPRPLDAGIEDLNSLRTSLRMLPPVVRHDTAFEHVYQSPLDPNQHYRKAGGIYAVFNASDYVSTPYGQVPVYPAGVEFHIGPPLGFDGSPLDPATAALLREIDPRFDLNAVDRQASEDSQPRSRPVVYRLPEGVATISSEGVRQQRLREITAKAVRKAGLGG